MSRFKETVDNLFSAERRVRALHSELAKSDPVEVVLLLRLEIEQAIALRDRDEASLRLVRLAELLGEFQGQEAVDGLIDILGVEEAEPRVVAGEVLQEFAFERFKEVALGVERALQRLRKGSVALAELPYVLAEVPEPGTVKLLCKFLTHADAEAVASAIEALAEVGDPGGITPLRALHKDRRTVSMDEADEHATVTIGELAQEASALLDEVQDKLRAARNPRPARRGR